MLLDVRNANNSKDVLTGDWEASYQLGTVTSVRCTCITFFVPADMTRISSRITGNPQYGNTIVYSYCTNTLVILYQYGHGTVRYGTVMYGTCTVPYEPSS